MAFRARIAQHIEIHRESRFPSLFPSAENEATRFDPRATIPLAPSLYAHLRARSQLPIYPSSPSPLTHFLPPSRVVLFYSPSTSAFASVATPFNLAPGSVPPCPYLIRLSLASDRFARTRLFLSLSIVPSFSLFGSLRVFLRLAKHSIYGDRTPGFQSFSHSLIYRLPLASSLSHLLVTRMIG